MAQVPTLVLGGARSDYERDALELYMEAQEAGASGCLMGRNVTKSPDPAHMIETADRHRPRGWTVDDALRGETWDFLKLKARPISVHRLQSLCRRLRGRP